MSRKAKELGDTLPPLVEPPVRVGKLDTLGDVRGELARLYRTARQTEGAKIDAAQATKLAYILQCIGRSLEGQELERRIADVERRLEVK